MMNRRSLNNKGMTLVELIISVALLSIVMTFLFKIIIDVKYEKDNSGFAEANQVNRAEFIRTVQNDLLDKKFESLIDGAADNKKLIISYRDKSTGEITVLDDVITYLVRDKDGNTKINSWELKDNDYKFGDINTETLASCYVKINILVERALDNSSIDDIEILAKYYSCPYTDPNYLNETVIRKQGGRNNAGVLTNVDFNYPSTDDDTGLYKASDDYGTSYYLRGNIIDNYVKFGKNSAGQDLYWRIIRINGDGTIRLFYRSAFRGYKKRT